MPLTMSFNWRKSGLIPTAAIFTLAAASTVQAAHAATLGEIDVSAPPYNANLGGTVDDTAAFQNALNAAGATGAKVRVPAGQYLFTGSLTVPAHVVMEGINDGERSYAGYSNGTANGDVVAGQGTVLKVTGSAGNSGGPNFITLGANAAVRNMTFYYPNQPLATSAGWNGTTPYPPTIDFGGRNGTVENVCGINPYMFIVNGSVGCTIRRVVAQPLFFGVNIDNDADTSGQSGEHLEDVRFLNTWDNSPQMAAWTRAHTVGFAVYRADEFSMRNCTVTGCSIGFAFSASGAGSAFGTLTSCSASNCAQAVRVTACTSGAGGGLVFDGGAFGNNSDVAVSIGNQNTGSVSFNSCRFFQSNGTLISNASAYGSVVSLVGCHFHNWGLSATGLNSNVSCVVCGDLSNPTHACGKTKIMDSDFDSNQYQYAYTPGEAGILFENNSTPNGVLVQPNGAAFPSTTGPQYVQVNNF